MASDRTIAYFSLWRSGSRWVPTYSGGLGVLAGDTIRSAADLKMPLVAMTLLHRKGYFGPAPRCQRVAARRADGLGGQDFVYALPGRTSVAIEGRTVQLRAWQYTVSA